MRTIMRTMMLGAAAAALLAGSAQAKGASANEWGAYGRDPGGTRFSPLTQVTPANVASLKPAWTFHTGDISTGKVKGGGPRSGFGGTMILPRSRASRQGPAASPPGRAVFTR